jgi:hypothetical protein
MFDKFRLDGILLKNIKEVPDSSYQGFGGALQSLITNVLTQEQSDYSRAFLRHKHMR